MYKGGKNGVKTWKKERKITFWTGIVVVDKASSHSDISCLERFREKPLKRKWLIGWFKSELPDTKNNDQALAKTTKEFEFKQQKNCINYKPIHARWPEYWEVSWRFGETCCYSDSIEKPSANAGEKSFKEVKYEL